MYMYITFPPIWNAIFVVVQQQKRGGGGGGVDAVPKITSDVMYVLFPESHKLSRILGYTVCIAYMYEAIAVV